MKWFQSNFAWCAFFLLLVLALIFPFQDGDLFFYLSMGRLFFEKGDFPNQDPYLFAFKNWHIAHEWLSYLIFYLFYQMGEWFGVLFLKMALWIGAFWVLARQSQKGKISQGLVLVILTLAALACSHRFVERASLFSDFFLVALTVYFLRTESPSRRALWLIPLLFVLWVNLHPAFVLGLLVWTVYVLSRKLWTDRRVLLSLGLSYLACLINPLFLEGVLYPLKTALKADWNLYRKMNYEWMPTFQDPFLSTWEARSLIVLILVAVFALLHFTRRQGRQSFFIWFLFLMNLYLAQNASRFMSTSALGIAAVAIFSLHDLRIPAWLDRGVRILATFMFLALALWISQNGYVSAAGPRQLGVGPDLNSFPVGAVDYIEAHQLQGRIFNQYDWGSYLIWRLNREDSLFIHGHIDDPKILARDYQGMNASKDFFDQSVKKYDIRYFLLDKRKLLVQPPPAIITYLQSWKILYQDDTSVLWSER